MISIKREREREESETGESVDANMAIRILQLEFEI